MKGNKYGKGREGEAIKGGGLTAKYVWDQRGSERRGKGQQRKRGRQDRLQIESPERRSTTLRPDSRLICTCRDMGKLFLLLFLDLSAAAKGTICKIWPRF